MNVTHTDLKTFAALVRKAYRNQDSSEVRLDNTRRGYCLIYNYWPDSHAETAEAEANGVTSLIIDGVDFIHAL